MAIVSGLSASAGQLPSGQRSFRKQGTVNPLVAPARYNFLYLLKFFEDMPFPDPSDCLVTATAVVLDLPLVTRDDEITSASVVEIL